MRDYGKIHTRIWHSQKFQSLSNDDAKLLYFYLHTCPMVNSIGCFVLRPGYAATDLKWEIYRFDRAIEGLSKALLIGRDVGEELVRIVDFLKRDPFTNKNHAAGAIKLARSLPDCEQKIILFQDIAKQKFTENLDTSPPKFDSPLIALSNGYRTPEPEPEPDKKDGGGGGCAQARDEAAFQHEAEELTHREKLLSAMGLDRSGFTGRGGQRAGSQADMIEAGRWSTDLGLTEADQIGVIHEVMAKKHDGPPSAFKFFTPAMQRLAAAKAAPRLETPEYAPTPAGGVQDARQQGQPEGRYSASRLNRIIAKAIGDE